MWSYPKNEDIFEHIGKHAKIAGVIMLMLGVAGIVFPAVMSFTTVAFVSWLLMLAGFMMGYFTYQSNKKDWLGWLKSFIAIGVALYMLFYPMGGVATIGLLLSIYFFMDSFAGFSIAFDLHPSKGWWIWALNALLSFGVGIFFIVGWPLSSLFLVGIFVGISLFFDGIALLMGSKFFTDMSKI